MTSWRSSNAVGWRPPEIDTTSSPTTVYQRRDYAETITDEGAVMWEYAERTMTHEEYAILTAAEYDIITELDAAYTEGVNVA